MCVWLEGRTDAPRVRHKNVIRLFEVIDTPRQIFLMMEYLNGGELFDYIVKKSRLKEPEACMFFHQIVWRDLQPRGAS